MHPPDSNVTLRPYGAKDAKDIAKIYAYYVQNSVMTFDLNAPDIAHMADKFEKIQQAGHPLIVAEKHGQVIGYAYASTYRARPAYRFTCENAIYLAHGETGNGLGSQLFSQLIFEAKQFGFNQMVAIITQGSAGSIALHKKFGFALLGEFPELGYKFDAWHGVTHMQKKL